MPRVVIAAGTGHAVPALAVADALRAEGAEVTFLGARGRAEAELVPAAGYEVDLLNLRGLDRRNPLLAAHAAEGRSARCPRPARPCAAGGRTSATAAAATWPGRPAAALGMGTPLVLTQPDRHLGLANPPAGPPRPARVPCLPDRGQGGRSLPRHRQAGAEGDPRGRSRRRSHPLRAGRGRSPPAASAAARGPGSLRLSTRSSAGRLGSLRPHTTATSMLTSRAAATTTWRGKRLEAAGRLRRSATQYEPTLADTLAACDRRLHAPAARCSDTGRSRGARRSWRPYPHAAAGGATQDANAAGRSMPAPPWSSTTPS